MLPAMADSYLSPTKKRVRLASQDNISTYPLGWANQSVKTFTRSDSHISTLQSHDRYRYCGVIARTTSFSPDVIRCIFTRVTSPIRYGLGFSVECLVVDYCGGPICSTQIIAATSRSEKTPINVQGAPLIITQLDCWFRTFSPRSSSVVQDRFPRLPKINGEVLDVRQKMQNIEQSKECRS